MRWTWAILLLAGGRAERRVVVEDFAKAGLWTDTGQSRRDRHRDERGARIRPPVEEGAPRYGAGDQQFHPHASPPARRPQVLAESRRQQQCPVPLTVRGTQVPPTVNGTGQQRQANAPPAVALDGREERPELPRRNAAVPDALVAGERRGATPESRAFLFLLGESAAGAAGRWETCVEPRHHLADECAAPRARRFQGGLGRVTYTLLTRSTRKTQSSAGSAAGPRRTWRSRGPSRTRRAPSRRAARSARAQSQG